MSDVSASFAQSMRSLRLAPEAANQMTHAAGFALSIFAAVVILRAAWASADHLRILGCAVYAITHCGIYAASTLSHSFTDPRRREFYRLADQVCIFVGVSGVYTPFGLVYALDGWWWLILAAMWVFALSGSAARIFNGDSGVAVIFFVLLGWIPILTLGRVYSVGQIPGLILVLAGGLAYTGGTWFLANDHRRPYFHATWHLCTIAGSALHFVFLWRYVALA